MDRYPFDAEYLSRLRDGGNEPPDGPPTVEHFVSYFTERLTIKLWRHGLTTSAMDDAVQETFLRVLQKVQSPNGIISPEKFGAFVFGVCNNYLYEKYRQDKNQDQLGDDCLEIPTPDPDVEQMLLRGEAGAKALRTLKLLKPKDAEILLALFVEEASKDEVCARFQIRRDYLRVVLHRAIARFRFLFPKG